TSVLCLDALGGGSWALEGLTECLSTAGWIALATRRPHPSSSAAGLLASRSSLAVSIPLAYPCLRVKNWWKKASSELTHSHHTLLVWAGGDQHHTELVSSWASTASLPPDCSI
ncbi:MAG: hypothetical protein ACK56I_04185, partial [bacterium]